MTVVDWKITPRTVLAFGKQRRIWTNGTDQAVRMLAETRKRFRFRRLPTQRQRGNGKGKKKPLPVMSDVPMSDEDLNILDRLRVLEHALLENASVNTWSCGHVANFVFSNFITSSLSGNFKEMPTSIDGWNNVTRVPCVVYLRAIKGELNHTMAWVVTDTYAHTLQAWINLVRPHVWSLPRTVFFDSLVNLNKGKKLSDVKHFMNNLTHIKHVRIDEGQPGMDKFQIDLDQETPIGKQWFASRPNYTPLKFTCIIKPMSSPSPYSTSM